MRFLKLCKYIIMNNYQFFALFPTPMMIANYLPDQRLVDFLANQETNPIFTQDQLPGDIMKSGTYSKNTKILSDPKCSDLKNFVIEHALKLSSECLGHKVEGLTDTMSWVSYKDYGQEHSAHNHPNSYISGVFYFEDVTTDTPLVFRRPRAASNSFEMSIPRDSEHNNEFSAENFRVVPKKGDIVLFPSHLMHYVPRNYNKGIRSSLAFNLMPTGSLGDDLFLTHFSYEDATIK